MLPVLLVVALRSSASDRGSYEHASPADGCVFAAAAAAAAAAQARLRGSGRCAGDRSSLRKRYTVGERPLIA